MKYTREQTIFLLCNDKNQSSPYECILVKYFLKHSDTWRPVFQPCLTPMPEHALAVLGVLMKAESIHPVIDIFECIMPITNTIGIQKNLGENMTGIRLLLVRACETPHPIMNSPIQIGGNGQRVYMSNPQSRTGILEKNMFIMAIRTQQVSALSKNVTSRSFRKGKAIHSHKTHERYHDSPLAPNRYPQPLQLSSIRSCNHGHI